MMKNIIILGVGVLLAVGCATSANKVDQGKAVVKSNWKNLKVLPEDITEDSLKGLMREYNAALGVKCNHCHASNAEGKMDFSLDAKKEKEYARHMITMTNELNKKHFDYDPADKQKVTCFTCHQGNVKPKKITDLAIVAPVTPQAPIHIK